MNDDEAAGYLQQALNQVVPGTTVSRMDPDEPLRDALEMDSLDFLSFAEQLSALSGLRVDEDDYPALATPRSCIGFLRSRAVRPAAPGG
ncbi:MAG: acyl carrier protein [Mycobacteriales bacterium]